MNRFSSSPASPRPRKDMLAVFQDGRRVLMHADEVARMMRKKSPREAVEKSSPPGAGPQSGAVAAPDDPGSGLPQASLPQVLHPQVLHPQVSRARVSSALDGRPPLRPGDGGGGKVEGYDIALPPIVPRSRSIANNQSWLQTAKLVAAAAGLPKRCHKPACRRARKCAGGKNACYLRAFETMDIVIQRDVLPLLKRAFGDADERSRAQENEQESAQKRKSTKAKSGSAE